MVERLLKCKRCGEKLPPEKMRYLESAKNLICVKCVEKFKHPSFEPKKVEDEAETKKKHRYKCQKCKHITQIKEGFNKQCSFCGGFDLILQEWNSDLDRLINDSSKSIYDN